MFVFVFVSAISRKLGSRKWAVGSGQWVVGSGQWAVCSGQLHVVSAVMSTVSKFSSVFLPTPCSRSFSSQYGSFCLRTSYARSANNSVPVG